MLFASRAEAGRLLAEALIPRVPRGGAAPVVLALPRGGVPVAVPVAAALDGELDVVVAAKVGAPGQPELGVGAVAEGAAALFDAAGLRRMGLTIDQLSADVAASQAEVARRVQRYRGGRAVPPVRGRVVVVVDDGLATGVTARAALLWLRERAPERLVMASPVCSRPACASISRVADDVVCLQVPHRFVAVGQWYAEFGQLTDEEVVDALGRAATPPGPG